MDWPASSGCRPIANPRLVGETNEQPLVPRFPPHKRVLHRPIRGHRATIRAVSGRSGQTGPRVRRRTIRLAKRQR